MQDTSVKAGDKPRTGILLGLLHPEDGGGMFLRHVGLLSTDCMALYPRSNFLMTP
jgi:hypothetical protein